MLGVVCGRQSGIHLCRLPVVPGPMWAIRREGPPHTPHGLETQDQLPAYPPLRSDAHPAHSWRETFSLTCAKTPGRRRDPGGGGLRLHTCPHPPPNPGLRHPATESEVQGTCWGWRGEDMWRMGREGMSIRRIADRLGVSRNTVRRYLRHPGLPEPRPRPKRPSKLDPFRDYLLQRIRVDGVTNSEAPAGAARTGLHRRPEHREGVLEAATTPSGAEGHRALRDRARRTGPGRLQGRHPGAARRAASTPVGLLHGVELVAGDLPGVPRQSDPAPVYPVPPPRLRAFRRRAPPLPLRLCSGQHNHSSVAGVVMWPTAMARL